MPTFIDESGDTGPIEEGGAPYCRLAAVWVPTIEDAGLFRQRIQQLRQRLGLRRDFEFKFSKTKAELVEAFFATALSQEFRFAFGSIDKNEAYWASSHRKEQHWACATEVAAAMRPLYYRAEVGRESPLKERIVVDDNRDRDFLNVVKRQFRGVKSRIYPGSSMIGNVIFCNSLDDEVLQLADMICGATGTMIDGGNRVWYDLIACRNVQPIGPQNAQAERQG